MCLVGNEPFCLCEGLSYSPPRRCSSRHAVPLPDSTNTTALRSFYRILLQSRNSRDQSSHKPQERHSNFRIRFLHTVVWSSSSCFKSVHQTLHHLHLATRLCNSKRHALEPLRCLSHSNQFIYEGGSSLELACLPLQLRRKLHQSWRYLRKLAHMAIKQYVPNFSPLTDRSDISFSDIAHHITSLPSKVRQKKSPAGT